MTTAKAMQNKFINEQLNKAKMLKLNGVKIMDTSNKTSTKNLYAIKDIDLGFLSVYEVPNNEIAKRSLSYEVNKEGTPFNSWPEKFELWKIGEFDTETGAITQTSELLATASQLKVVK